MTDHIVEILERSGNQVAWAIKSCRLLGLWQSVVDERAGKHTEAIKIRNKVLYVSTSSSTWAQELSLLRKEIIKKFNERAGEEAINDVRFKAGGEILAGGIK